MLDPMRPDQDCIHAFAGDELLRAKYYPEDNGYLLELEPLVWHYVTNSESIV